MNNVLRKIIFTGLLIFLIQSSFYAQLTVTSATACPGQTVVLTATWPNVAASGYTISRSPTSFTPQASPNFTVNDLGTPSSVIVFTITGASAGGTATTTATLTLISPPTLTLTPANAAYCYGGTATILATPAGSSSYSVAGPAGTGPFPPSSSNIINIPNLTSPTYNGQYTVTANLSGCISKGTATINVSPNSQLTLNPPAYLCQESSFTLSAALANGNSWNWSSASINSTGQPNYTLAAAQPSNTGTYTMAATFSFVAGSSSTNCPVTATTSIDVLQKSSVSISASPSPTVCQGSNLTLAATTSVTPGGYSWTGPQSFASSQQNPVLISVAPANSGSYVVTALYVNNFTACPTSATLVASIIGTTAPTALAPANICQGGTATLTANAPGALNYSWTGPTWTSSNATDSIKPVQPSDSGPYFITANFGNGCSSTKSVVINVIPVSSISVVPPQDVCQPDNAYLQASAIGATSFTWSGPGGNVGYTSNVTLYHPPVSATGIYTVTAGFSGGALTCTAVNTVSLNVKPLLIFTLAPPMLVCYNSSVHIDGPGGATSYSWTSSSSFSANTQNIDLPAIQPSSSGTYSLAVSLNGCVTSASTTIDVLTPISFLQPFFDRTICRGDSIFLNAPVTGGTGNYAYTWDPSIYLSANIGSSVVGVPMGTTIYNVMVHDIVCPDYNITGSFNVFVKQPPASMLSLSQIEGCAPLCQLYDANSDSTTRWVNYDFGNNIKYQKLPADDKTICLPDPGTYTLTIALTGTNGCTGTIVYPQPITVHPTPSVTIVNDPESPTITDNVSFGISSNYSVSSYQWIFDTGTPGMSDTLLTGNPIRTYGNAGTYPVYLVTTTDNGCSDTAVKFLQIFDDFNVFIPNSFTPNGDGINDVFQMKGSGISPDNFLMELFDRKGHVLFATRDVDAGWDGTTNGTKVQNDVFVYKISLVGVHSEGKKEFVGQFLLIR